MSSKSTFSYGVIIWMEKSEETLQNELVEVVALKSLILKGPPQVGGDVSLQYKNELWTGKILSLHGTVSLETMGPLARGKTLSLPKEVAANSLRWDENPNRGELDAAMSR